MKKLYIIVVFMTFTVSLLAQNKGIPFTQDDRDRLIRLEEQYHSLRREMNIKFDSIQIQINDIKIQINDIKTFMLWGFGILFGVTITSMIGLVGFILWDRRTTLAPVVEETKKFAEKQILLEKVIIESTLKSKKLKINRFSQRRKVRKELNIN